MPSNNKVIRRYRCIDELPSRRNFYSSVYEQRVHRRSYGQKTILFFRSILSFDRKFLVNPRRRQISHLRQYIIIINNHNICYIFTATQCEIQRRRFPCSDTISLYNIVIYYTMCLCVYNTNANEYLCYSRPRRVVDSLSSYNGRASYKILQLIRPVAVVILARRVFFYYLFIYFHPWPGHETPWYTVCLKK